MNDTENETTPAESSITPPICDRCGKPVERGEVVMVKQNETTHLFSCSAPTTVEPQVYILGGVPSISVDPREGRARTAEELRADFMGQCRVLNDYWAAAPIASVEERLAGLTHSILAMIDGVSAGIPALDLVARPHPDDKAALQDDGDDWVEDGTALNEGVMLHEEWSRA